MSKWSFEKFFMDLIFLTLGCSSLAFGVTAILRPNGLITGGATGASIVISELIGIPYTMVYYGLSVAILLSSILFIGKAEGLKIVFLTLTFPMVLIGFEAMNIEFIENDLFLASIYFGIFAGTGVGLILKRGYSMGGTESIAKILHRRLFSFLSLSQILLGIDLVIVVSSLLIYDKRIALYAIFTQYVFMKTVDTILFGMGSRKVKIEIISDACDAISDYIMNEVKRGTSMYEIKGGYSNESKMKVVSVCSPRESMLIKRFIANLDPGAFVNVLPVSSVWGEGIGFDALVDED